MASTPMTQAPMAVCLIGCGALFETVLASWPAVAQGRELMIERLDGTDAIATDGVSRLARLDPARVQVFAAVDANALNHARLDLYGQARLVGLRPATLVHPTAWVADGAAVADNCWIGARASVDVNVKIGSNSIIGAGAQVHAGAVVGASAWVGAGASIGAGSQLGTNCVIGDNVHLAAGQQIGRHCSIDVPGHYAISLAAGSFIDPLFSEPVRIYRAPTPVRTPAPVPSGAATDASRHGTGRLASAATAQVA